MLSISAISNAEAAGSYYAEIDDYMRKGQSAPTQWQGKGAETLGLEGEVDAEQFTALLRGELPDGTVLGRINGAGEIEHKAGWDLTFSAPKSVSIASLVVGDERIIAAHERAVSRALQYVESTAATARDKKLELQGQAHATDNLVFATFRHATSREQDPQLHTHSVLLNMTRDQAGKWRSIESRPIFRMQKDAGEFYRSELARELRALGYEIQVQPGKEFNFELKGVTPALIEHFSGRSAQIEAALAKRGKTRETATAAEKEAAALDTRKGKEAMDHAELRAKWRREALNLGLAASGDRPRPPEAEAFAEREWQQAARALKQAAEHLSEREARFSRPILEATSRGFAKGQAGVEAIRQAITVAEASGELVERRTRRFDLRTGRKAEALGFTTPQAIQTEQRMLVAVDRLSSRSEAISTEGRALDAIERRAKASGYAFSDEQKRAAHGILTHEKALHVVQGLAGTAKTSSVLAATAEAARRAGYEIKAVAPTASAAQTLTAEIGGKASTIAAHINEQREPRGKQLWIIDEASMICAGDMQRLLAQAERESARVVLVGDTHQLGSVEAGRAFEQVQQHVREANGQVHELSEIVRQTNRELREAIYHSVKGNARATLEKIDAGAGRVVEISPQDNARETRAQARQDRIAQIADDYTNIPAAQRAKALVIDPSRDGRCALNEAIRSRLIHRGEIQGEGLKVTAIESKDLSRVEAKLAECYAAGDVLKSHRNYSSLGLAKGETARVVSVEHERNRITIETREGKQTELNPARYACFSVHQVRKLEIAPGDVLIARSNDLADRVKNGAELRVVAVEDRHILARDTRGQAVELDATKPLAVDLGYALTAHQAQGRTAERVLIHAESTRLNLQTQQQMYVSVSRARQQAVLYTDDRKALVAQLERESGRKEMALEQHRAPEPPKSEPLAKDRGAEISL